MIRVLFFVENLTEGGAEKVLRNLANRMDQTKFDITVQTAWPCDAKKYLAPGIHYRSMYTAQTKANRLRYRVEAASGMAYLMHVKEDYDIECAYLECGATKIMAGSTNREALKLAWIHCDLQKKMPDAKAFAKKAAAWYAKYDKVVCVSENVRERYVELFGDTPEAVVVHNTVDDADIRCKAEQPLPPDAVKRKMTAVSLGRLSEQKGYDRLLRCHKRLLDEGIDCDLWILGEGPERKALERYIAENCLSDSVRLFGFRENPYPFLWEADVLVCSSRYEGLSTFVTEGLILGKPIVTTDCTGMCELLGDSEYGLITENGEAGLFDGMKQMLTNKALRAQYAEKAAARGEAFSAELLIAETERFLEESLKEKQTMR